MKFGRNINLSGSPTTLQNNTPLILYVDSRNPRCWDTGSLRMNNLSNYSEIPHITIDTEGGTITKQNGVMRVNPTFSTNASYINFEWDKFAISASAEYTITWAARYNFNTDNSSGAGQNFMTLEPSNNTNGQGQFSVSKGSYFSYSALELDDAGGVYVGGQNGGFSGSYSAHVSKFDNSGSVQQNWNASPRDSTVNSCASILNYKGKMLLGGTNYTRPGIFVADTGSGAAISRTLHAGGGGNYVRHMVLDSVEDVIYAMGSTATAYSGSNVDNKVMRLDLNLDFKLDTSFNSTTPAFNNNAQYDGVVSGSSIFIVGEFASAGGTTTNRIAKLDKITGALDTTFATNVGSGFNDDVYNIQQQSDGSLICTGRFTSFNGTSVNRIAKLDGNGNLDTTFATNIGTGFNTWVYGTQVQSDDKIICVGRFTTYNGTLQRHVTRVNADGTLDTAFATNIGDGLSQQQGNYVITQPDGKILISYQNIYAPRRATTWDGETIPDAGVLRLNSDGTRDTTWSLNWKPVELSRENNNHRYNVSTYRFGLGLFSGASGRAYTFTVPYGDAANDYNRTSTFTELNEYTMTWNGTNTTTYRNGVPTGRTLTIGGEYKQSPWRFRFDNSLYDTDFIYFRMYDRILTDEEIYSNYQATLSNFSL